MNSLVDSLFKQLREKLVNSLPHSYKSTNAFVHYNMHFQLRTITIEKKEQEFSDIDPFDIRFVQTKDDSVMDWQNTFKAGNPLLDEARDPPRLSQFLNQQIDKVQARENIGEEDDDHKVFDQEF